MSQLFEELIIDILSRLPVRSLLRFRCVSKLWCNWIDGQEFINMQLQRSAKTNTNLHLILLMWNDITDLDLYSVHFDDLRPVHFDNAVINRSVTRLNCPGKSMSGYKTVGFCNGLICIRDLLDYVIILWNPFTRRYKELPTAPGDDDIIYNYVKATKKYKKKIMFHYGFGYDNVNNDYKVVRIIQCLDTADYEFYCNVVVNLVTVYSLRLNSWKIIQDFAYDEYVFDTKGASCFVSDASHWFVYPGWDKIKSKEWLILAFNHKTEEFSVVPHPNWSGRVTRLQDLGGLLCILELERDGCVGVWVMKEYGVMESWIKLHSVGLRTRPVVYTKNYGEKLLVQTDCRLLTWYKIKEGTEGTSNRITFPGSPEKFCAYTCLESLVSLGVSSHLI